MGNCVGGKGAKKDPTLLTEEEIKLLLDNTKLNRAQIKALHQNFLKECPSGKLTKKDFVKLFKEVHPSENKKEKADKFCEYVFKVIDRENLGYISFQDFVLCFSLTSYGDFAQKCEFAFRLYDLDKDGKISKKEMTQVLEALYDLSGITDRKGDKAPAKKVEEIIRKLNNNAQAVQAAPAADSQAAPEPAAAPSSPPSSPSKDNKKSKDKKKEEKPKKEKPPKERKPAKEPKPGKEPKPPKEPKEPKPPKEPKQPKAAKVKVPDFITKDQFIEACSKDEAIKTLFVDSIFANPSSDSKLDASVSVSAPSVSVSAPAVSLNGPSVSLGNDASLVLSAPSISIESKTVINDNQEPNNNVTSSTRVDVHENTVVNTSEVKVVTIEKPVEEPASATVSVSAPEVNVNLSNVNLSNVDHVLDKLGAEISASVPEAVQVEVKPVEVDHLVNVSVSSDSSNKNENESQKSELVVEAPKVELSTS